MDALLEHHGVAHRERVFVHAGPPPVAVAMVVERPIAKRAHGLFRDEASDRLADRQVAEVQSNREREARSLTEFHDLAGFGEIERQRLLGKERESGREDEPGLREMTIRRRDE